MKYTAHVKVMPLKDLLDPQGKAVMGGLKNLGLHSIEDVRIGKHIILQIESDSEKQAMDSATQATRQLLANAVMENFEITIQQV